MSPLGLIYKSQVGVSDKCDFALYEPEGKSVERCLAGVLHVVPVNRLEDTNVPCLHKIIVVNKCTGLASFHVLVHKGRSSTCFFDNGTAMIQHDLRLFSGRQLSCTTFLLALKYLLRRVAMRLIQHLLDECLGGLFAQLSFESITHLKICVLIVLDVG